VVRVNRLREPFGSPLGANEYLLLRCASIMLGPFFYLAPEARAPSFLVVMEKSAPQQPCKTFHAPVDSHPQPRFQFDLQVQVDSSDEGDGSIRAGIEDWILADVDVDYVLLERGGCGRFLVGGLRIKLTTALDLDRQLPAERAMCSGIVEMREERISQSSTEPVAVVATCVGGDRYQIGELQPLLESKSLQTFGHVMP
jgi:hypothetical protein